MPVDRDADELRRATEPVERAREYVVQRDFALRLVDSPTAGCRAIGETVRIGTHPSNDLVLDDRAVSAFHCEITVTDARAVLKDLGSRNGTSIDGVSVEIAHLRDGAVISVGRTRVRFELGPKTRRVPLSSRTSLGGLVGGSTAMRALYAVLELAARSETSVLLTGETGTGKDLAAEAIHANSARQARPLVVLDCTAIPAALFAGHVFGYERGAFTGADRAHTGVFASAHGGTLFLDEVGDLAPALQPVLLRALERREVVPIGSARATRFDVRIVAATHRDLRREINAGRFRADLYYRLAGMEIRLPPLRQRLEDLPALLARFATSIRADAVAAGELTSERMLRELRAHPWPGNVRELRNFVERSLAMPGAAIDEPAAHGGWDLDASKPLRAARERWQGDVERRYFDELLRRNQHNVTKAAQAAGLARGHFYRLLKRHGLK